MFGVKPWYLVRKSCFHVNTDFTMDVMKYKKNATVDLVGGIFHTDENITK